MNTANFYPAVTDAAIQEIAELAEIIWHQHFTQMIGEEQVNYMIDKFQSFPAIKAQIENTGYEYYQIHNEGVMCGYTGIHEEEEELFLSKLYIHKDARGQHLATQTLNFLVELCKERGLKKIRLTCNKHNTNTLEIYKHLGFQITDEQVADIGQGFVMDDYILTYII